MSTRNWLVKLLKHIPIEVLKLLVLFSLGFYFLLDLYGFPSSLSEFLNLLWIIRFYLLFVSFFLFLMLGFLQVAGYYKARKSDWNELSKNFPDREVPDAPEWIFVTLSFGDAETVQERVIVQASGQGLRFSLPWYFPPWSRGLLLPFFIPWAKIDGIKEWVWAAHPRLKKIPGFSCPMLRLALRDTSIHFSVRKDQGTEFFQQMPRPSEELEETSD